jgi:hypothetical protein
LTFVAEGPWFVGAARRLFVFRRNLANERTKVEI